LKGIAIGFFVTVAAAFVGLIAGIWLGASGIRLSNGLIGDTATILGPQVLLVALAYLAVRRNRDAIKGFYIAASLVFLVSVACVGLLSQM
jgi:hypothetical protein